MAEFDKLAEDYHRREVLLGDTLGPWLEGNLPGGETACDLTCGSGRHAKILAGHYNKVLAHDISETMISLAIKHNFAPNIIYQTKDLFEVQGQYDLVFSAAALHDLDNLHAALSHLSSLVSQNGYLIIADVTAKHSPKPWLWYRLSPLYWLMRNLYKRPYKEALELYHLCTEPEWIQHLHSNSYLTPENFISQYSKSLPGASFTKIGRLSLCVWQKKYPLS